MNNNTRLAKFWDWIKTSLNAASFEELQVKLGASNYKWTSLQNGTKDFSQEELNILANFLGISRTQLIEEYGLGLKHLSGLDIMDIAMAEGVQLTFKA
jgi:hypothetical protein